MGATDAYAHAGRWQPYPAYKPSGVKWLGDIPAHWEVRKLKHSASVTFSTVDKHTFEGEEPVRLCNYVDVYHNDFITEEIEFMQATATQREVARFALREADVLVTKDSESWEDIAVSAYVPATLDNVVCGYHLALIRPHHEVTDGKYLFRAFQARGINDQFRVAANGITRYGLPKSGIDSSLFLIPPVAEQRAIAAFLDRETTRFDALIAKKQRLIELLQEKRTVLISQAVTKGLDPHVAMKDSGVEWLGEIPAHWSVTTVRNLIRMCRLETQDGNHGELHPRAEHYVDDGIPFVMANNVRNGIVDLRGCNFISEEQARSLRIGFATSGDVLLTHKGTIGETAVVPAVLDVPFVMLTPQVTYYRVKHSMLHNRFLYFYFQSRALQAQMEVIGGAQSTRGYISLLAQRDLWVPLLPVAEQESICDYLDEETAKITRLISKVRDAIERLREYRTALISAAVTGKMDVRPSPPAPLPNSGEGGVRLPSSS